MSEMLLVLVLNRRLKTLKGCANVTFASCRKSWLSAVVRVLPGVRELLNVLVSDPRCHWACDRKHAAVGSAQATALRLWDYFKFGTYGHHALLRRDLCQPAWESIQQYACTARSGKSVIMVSM